MFDTADTIVAIATPPGRGGIGIVRLSGPAAQAIARRLTARPGDDEDDEDLEPRRATLARVNGPAGGIDRVLVTSFPAPHSYTGDAVVEISAHGSPVLLRQIVASATAAGARLAEPGEFTLRAYLNGRIDLVQAEAVRDLVEAVTPAQARAAFDQLEGTLTGRIRAIDAALFDLTARLEASLDFPAEGYHFVEASTAACEISAIVTQIDALLADAGRGRLVREGLHAVIAGRPNTGKSSLFNRLAGAGRAIVTEIPGTTRDLLTEVVDVHGVPVTLVDTAGMRQHPADAIEAEGIARAAGARAVAALTLVVLDRSAPLTADDRQLLEETEGSARVVIANKADLPAAAGSWDPGAPAVHVSALTGEGFDELHDAILRAMEASPEERDVPAITNARHADLLAQVRRGLTRAAAAAAVSVPEEFVLADVHEARALLEEITGRRHADAIVHAIFERFCIGK
jgi:tRNA modification GTPase